MADGLDTANFEASANDKHLKYEALIHSARHKKSKEMNVCFFYVEK